MSVATASLIVVPAFCKEGAIRVAASFHGKYDFLSIVALYLNKCRPPPILTFNINKYPHHQSHIITASIHCCFVELGHCHFE
jgi:hypothetical protein